MKEWGDKGGSKGEDTKQMDQQAREITEQRLPETEVPARQGPWNNCRQDEPVSREKERGEKEKRTDPGKEKTQSIEALLRIESPRTINKPSIPERPCSKREDEHKRKKMEKGGGKEQGAERGDLPRTGRGEWSRENH